MLVTLAWLNAGLFTHMRDKYDCYETQGPKNASDKNFNPIFLFTERTFMINSFIYGSNFTYHLQDTEIITFFL